MARLYERWSARGRRIVLLPRTFGPFSDPRIGESAARIVKAAAVAFVRDEESQRHLVKFGVPMSSIPVYPDYTLPVHADTTSSAPYANRACLIPNVRMLDKTAARDSANYVRIMSAMLEALDACGMSPFLLLMQHASDAPVAEAIKKAVGRDFEIVRLNDPRTIKGIIGACSIVVSSRLHGCICALGQAVPCIATGWNHKYEELYRDFDSPELIIRNLADVAGAQSLLTSLMDGAIASSISERLRARAARIKNKNAEMWESVFCVVGHDNPSATSQ
jgi:colanic acid/amylovoran biosynthesis protein